MAAPAPRHRPVWIAWLAVYLGLTLAFCWPILAHPLANGVGDWDQHTFYHAALLRSLATGQFPHWNPWYCGGNVLWANPQVPLISPIYLLAWVAPIAVAMKLNVVAHYLAGLIGMHLLLRRVAGVRSPFVVVYLAALTVFAGGIALHLNAGHTNFLALFWLPLTVYYFLRAAAGDVRQLILGALVIAVPVLNGAPHVVPLAAVVLGGLGLGAAVFGRTLRPLVIGVVMVVVGCVYAAPKLVPSISFAQSPEFHDRRPVKQPDAMTVDMLTRALWDPSVDPFGKLDPKVQLYAWHEYGNYMGWFGAPLSVLAAGWILVRRRKRDQWPEAAAALGLLIVLLLALGEFASWAPAYLIREVPILASFRIPSRHILLAPLFGALCVASVARAWQGDRWPRYLRASVAALCVAGTVQLIWVNRQHLDGIFVLPPDQFVAQRLPMAAPVVALQEPDSVPWTRLGENSKFMRTMAAGVTALNCYEPLVARRIARPGPAVLEGPDDVVLSRASFSPNRVTADAVVGRAPARVVLNQNYAQGWSSDAGPIEPDPESGRPSVVLPAGFAGTVTFTFATPGLALGFGIWILAIAGSVVIWRRARMGRTRL